MFQGKLLYWHRIEPGRYISGPLEIRRTLRRWALSVGPYRIATRPTLYMAKRYAEEMA